MSSELRMLRVQQVAEKLAIAVPTVWEWARKGRLPAPIRMGSVTVWSSEILDEWIRAQYQEAA